MPSGIGDRCQAEIANTIRTKQTAHLSPFEYAELAVTLQRCARPVRLPDGRVYALADAADEPHRGITAASLAADLTIGQDGSLASTTLRAPKSIFELLASGEDLIYPAKWRPRTRQAQDEREDPHSA